MNSIEFRAFVAFQIDPILVAHFPIFSHFNQDHGSIECFIFLLSPKFTQLISLGWQKLLVEEMAVNVVDGSAVEFQRVFVLLQSTIVHWIEIDDYRLQQVPERQIHGNTNSGQS